MYYYRYDVSDLAVRVGSNDALSGGQTHNVSKVVVHSDFSRQYYNDMALLKTSTKIVFTSTVMRVTLAYYIPAVNSVGVLIGYGSNEVRYVNVCMCA